MYFYNIFVFIYRIQILNFLFKYFKLNNDSTYNILIDLSEYILIKYVDTILTI